MLNKPIVANSVFDSGSGTAASPYVITTLAQLKAVSNYPSAYFILEADINDALTSSLCSTSSPFKGNFNGNGHTVIVSISDSEELVTGLFSWNTSGSILNLNVSGNITFSSKNVSDNVTNSNFNIFEDMMLLGENAFASGINLSDYAGGGGIAGYNKGKITGCTSSVTVSVLSSIQYTGVGGIVAYNAGTITDCNSSAAVSASGSIALAGIGGIAGCNAGTITSCTSSAVLSTSGSSINNMAIGGLAGYNMANISNSSATGDVSPFSATGTICEGGLIGYAVINSTVSDSFASGTVATGTASGNIHKGGLIGYSVKANIGGCSASGMIPASTVTDDQVNEGGLIGRADNTTISNCHATGNVTGGTGSRIGIGGLIGMNQETAVSDCYATGTVTSPVGSGTLRAGGLIGYNKFGTIDDCYAEGDVSGSGYLGGLVGLNYNEDSVDANNNHYIKTLALVKNSHASGNVTASLEYGGGLIGVVASSGSTALAEISYGITGCYATGDVTVSSGATTVGGLFGMLQTMSAQDCFYSGTVTVISSCNAGGIAGWTECDSVIDNCYSTGNAYGMNVASGSTTLLGGLVGYMKSGTAQYSYFAGNVQGANAYAGGLIGKAKGTVTNCYWNIDLIKNSIGNSTGNTGTGLTTDQMTGDSAEANMADLNFNSVWTAKSNSSEGGSIVRYYPQLSVFANSTSSDIQAASLESVTIK